jgi:DNA polymerase-3 subunit epsilon
MAYRGGVSLTNRVLKVPAISQEHQWQPAFEDLGRSLQETTFVVVDLETTGGSVRDGSAITEFGAVKVRGGKVIQEFQTFVNPGHAIPAFITVLTGITDAMVLKAPKIAEIFPTFLEFCGSKTETVLVAHNAPFDLSFLKGAAAQLNYPWPNFPVVDTARIARLVLTREEVRDCKLSTLAKFYGTEVTPSHRALDDAQATVEVLHGLLERLGSLGVTTLEDLQGFTNRVTPEQRAKKHLAQGIPTTPGVYIFRDSQGEALYVGTAKNLRSRVRNYFGASETRKRIRDMISLLHKIDTIQCATILEAQIRELRLISQKQPRFNRRSKGQEKAIWLRITDELFPRLSAVRGNATLSDEVGWSGPFNGLAEAQLAMEAIHEIVPLRQCNKKITTKNMSSATSCALFDMGRCGAPCVGVESSETYQLHVRAAQDILHRNGSAIEMHLVEKMKKLSQAERFEEAGEYKNRLSAFIVGSSRGQRIRSLTLIPHLIAATPVQNEAENSWEFICVRFGRLAGSAISKSTATIKETIISLSATAEVVLDNGGVLPASSYEEVEKILTYLEQSEVRLVEIQGNWSMPVFGSGAFHKHLIRKENQWQDIQGRFN